MQMKIKSAERGEKVLRTRMHFNACIVNESALLLFNASEMDIFLDQNENVTSLSQEELSAIFARSRMIRRVSDEQIMNLQSSNKGN